MAVGTAAGELKEMAQSRQAMAPPVAANAAPPDVEPFIWEAAGLEFAFEFTGNRHRFRGLLPHGLATPDGILACADISGLETSILCTGEDVPDHHGAKFTAGSPGIRMTFLGRHEPATPRGKRLILSNEDAALDLHVQSIHETT